MGLIKVKKKQLLIVKNTYKLIPYLSDKSYMYVIEFVFVLSYPHLSNHRKTEIHVFVTALSNELKPSQRRR